MGSITRYLATSLALVVALGLAGCATTVDRASVRSAEGAPASAQGEIVRSRSILRSPG